jgi:hypothetical protein
VVHLEKKIDMDVMLSSEACGKDDLKKQPVAKNRVTLSLSTYNRCRCDVIGCVGWCVLGVQYVCEPVWSRPYHWFKKKIN